MAVPRFAHTIMDGSTAMVWTPPCYETLESPGYYPCFIPGFKDLVVLQKGGLTRFGNNLPPRSTTEQPEPSSVEHIKLLKHVAKHRMPMSMNSSWRW